MAVQDEKVSKFLSAINSYAEEQKQKILEEIQQYMDAEMEKAEREVLTDAYRLIQKEMAQMRGRICREISRKEMEDRKRLLSHRMELVEGVFSLAREKLADYTKTPEYEAFLMDKAKELSGVLKGEDTVLYLRQVDMPLAERLKKAFGRPCAVEASGEIEIGGLIGSCPSQGLLADETLDGRLEGQREWFAENSGLVLV